MGRNAYVEFVPFTTGGEQIPPLASEQLDVGMGAVAAALFNAVVRGVPIKLDVNLTVMSFPDMTTAFANRAIDAGMYQEPLTTLGVESGDVVRWLRADELYPNQQNGVLMFSPALAARTDTGRRYITAYLRSVRDYLAAFDRDEGREDVIRVRSTIPRSRTATSTTRSSYPASAPVAT